MTSRMLNVHYDSCVGSVCPKMTTTSVNIVTQDPRLRRLPAPLCDSEDIKRVPAPYFPCGDHNSDGHTDDTISQEQSSLSSKPKPSGPSKDAWGARGSSRYNSHQQRQGK